MVYCHANSPSNNGQGCAREAGHSGPHQAVNGEAWVVESRQPGFTREELTAAAAEQQRRLTVFDTLPVAPSKDEILAAIGVWIDENQMHNPAGKALMVSVSKLFADRGL